MACVSESVSTMRPSLIIYHFVYTLMSFPRAYRFIREHRLWEGLMQYGWIIRLLVVASVLLGLSMLSVFIQWIHSLDITNGMAMVAGVGTLFSQTALEGYELFTSGFMKYVILILLEVFVYHFMRRTLMLTVGKSEGITFTDFFHAQIRMIKIALRSWIMELIASILIKVFFAIFGIFDFLEPVLLFGVQCFYFGFAIMDNYNEQFGLSIDASARYSRDYLGVALALGLVLYALLLIPILGTVVGPVLCTTTAALVMVKQADLHYSQPAPEPVDHYQPEDATSSGSDAAH